MAFPLSPITCTELIKALVIKITLDRSRKRGYEALYGYCGKIVPSRLVGKLLYMRPAWFSLSPWSLILPKGRRIQWCGRRSPVSLSGGTVCSIRPRCNLYFHFIIGKYFSRFSIITQISMARSTRAKGSPDGSVIM